VNGLLVTGYSLRFTVGNSDFLDYNHFVGAVQSGRTIFPMERINAVTQLTMVFAISGREGDGQFCFPHPAV
jgi:hypothetical protein